MLNEEHARSIDPSVLLTRTAPVRNRNRRELEARLFDDAVVDVAARHGRRGAVEAPTRRAKSTPPPAAIRDLIAEGYRLRDIAVLVRDLSVYHELIDASFHEHGIPYFADRRRPTAHHPLLQLRAFAADARPASVGRTSG